MAEFRDFIRCTHKLYRDVNKRKIKKIKFIEVFDKSCNPKKYEFENYYFKTEESGESSPLIKFSGKKITPKNRLELAFSSVLLKTYGYKNSEYGYSILGNSEIKRLKISAKIPEAEKAKRQIQKIIKMEQAPEILMGHHCRGCTYIEECDRKLREIDHISLIFSLSKGEVHNLKKRGIRTVNQLADSFRPARLRHIKRSHYPALKARAIVDQKVYVKEALEIISHKTKVFLDVESVPQDDFYYLIGALVDDGISCTYYPFWATKNTNTKQNKICSNFIDLTSGLGEFQIISYGSFDKKFMSHMLSKQEKNIPENVQKAIENCYNLLETVYSHFYFPTYSNSLKDIAKFIGFKYTNSIGDGAQSIGSRLSWEKSKNEKI